MINDMDLTRQLEKMQMRSIFNQMLVKKDKSDVEITGEIESPLRISEIQTLTALSGTRDADVWKSLVRAHDEQI